MNKFGCVLVSALAISAAGLGCSKQSESTTPAQGAVGAEGSRFRFVPTDRDFTQTTVDSRTISSPGSSLSSTMKGEYTWDVSTEPEESFATYSAQLRRVVLSINGQNAVNQVPAENEVQIRVDNAGRVQRVTGTESLGQGLTAQLRPEQQAGARALIDEAAKTAVVERFQATVADLQGRPTALGSKWTVQSQAGGPVRSKTWTVRGVEVCGSAQCVRVESTYDIDSQGISEQLKGELAGVLVDEQGVQHEVTLSGVDVKANDSILVEPNTLFLHQARFEQTARLILEKDGERTPMLITEVRDLTTRAR